MQQLVQLRGRGAPQNPKNRFEDAEYVPDLEARDPDEPDPPKSPLTSEKKTGRSATLAVPGPSLFDL